MENFIDNAEKCPNCELDSYVWWKCPNCGLGMLEDYDFYNNRSPKILQQALQTTQTLQTTLEIKPKNQKINLQMWNYTFYKLIIYDWKIKNILFKIPYWETKKWNERYINFKLRIDYEFINKTVDNLIYYESNPEERNAKYTIIKVDKLKILWIQKKAKSGYGQYFKNVNYFRYCWIEYDEIKEFTNHIVKEFHNIF